jgi:regulator of nucleoside diphosphate kinase
VIAGPDRRAVFATDATAREQLKRARLLVNSPDKAAIGDRIEFEDEISGERRIVMLVHPSDAHDRRGCISVLEPVGMAVLGLGEGQSIDWPLENGERRRIRLIRVISASRSHNRR